MNTKHENSALRAVTRVTAHGCRLLIGGILGIAVLGEVHGAIPIIGQNFDSMGPGGTTLPAGWSAGYLGAESSANRLAFAPYAGDGLALTNMPVVVWDGTGALPIPNVGTLFNIGLVGDGDRALGSYPRTTPSGDHVYQVAIANTTGAILTEITLSYAGEQWNQNQGTSSSGPEMIRVLVSSASPISGFTYYPSLDFTAPQQGPGSPVQSPLNGNDPLNRVAISGTITLPTPVAPGDTFYVRWHDWNDNGTSDHYLAIDDVVISAEVPEPLAGALLALPLGALVLRRSRRSGT